jgi:uncharacterized protein YqgV (UPF0045/DUF77 family)
MNIGVEISLYPINADFIPPIQAFIDRLNTHPRLRVITNDMSTQVFGEFDDVMPAVNSEIRRSFEENALCVFAMKVLGPFSPGSY